MVSVAKSRRLRTFATAISLLLGFVLYLPDELPSGSVARPNLLPAAVAADAPKTTEPIKIGFLASLSGAAGVSGQDMVNGLTLYLEQNHYKMAGRPVKLIVEDDAGQASIALAKVHKFIEKDKVNLISGILFAQVAYLVAPTVDQRQMPTVISVSGADELTQRKCYKWVVRTGWTSSQPTHPFGEWVYKKLKYKQIATIGSDYPFGWESVGGFQQSFEEAGGKIIQKQWPKLPETDFTSYIDKIPPQADAVFTSVIGTPGINFIKQYRSRGVSTPLLANGACVDESLLHTSGPEPKGILSALMYSASLDTLENKRFVAAYKKRFNQFPSYYAEATYTSGMWIDKAAQAVTGDVENKVKFLEALKTVKIKDAPRGPVTLDNYGNPIENIYVRRIDSINGELHNTVIATFKNVSQFWRWKPETYLKQPVYTWSFPPCKNCIKN